MIIEINNFNLHDTVTCGQIFRFKVLDDNSYTVILSDRVVNLKMDGNKLYIDSNNMDNIEDVVRRYFDLDFDYDLINKEIISIDKDNASVVNSCIGLKMINEPKLEVIISYILSANNGVPQIRNGLDNISRMFGKKVSFRDQEYYLFPTIDELKNASVTDFRNCKTGFRDKYKGIGEKVASCILLFGYHRFDVFPIDTWVKKYMKDKYNLDKVSDIRKFMLDKYSLNCGLVIQYIFHYSRNIK